eukprot:2962204-Ditylum_brightwellii.AAC.1
MFKHDFKVAMHRKSNWRQILKINTSKGVKDVLINFMLIEEDNLKGACIKCTPKEKVTALNMFIALWKSFAQHVKMTLQTVTDEHKCNVQSIIRTSQDLLNTLPNKLNELGFDIAKFCGYTTKTIKTLRSSGGTDKQAPLKLYETLVTSHNDSFHLEIQVYKAAIADKSKALELLKLATMAKAEYTFLKIRSQWNTTSKSTISKKHSADNIVALCAKLGKKGKIIKSFQSSTSSRPPSSHKPNCYAHFYPNTRPTGSFDYHPSWQRQGVCYQG